MRFLLLSSFVIVLLYDCAETDAATFTRSPGNHKDITIHAKNQQLVEEIKQELTNNNDDYEDTSPLTPAPPRAPHRVPLPPPRVILNNRRSLNNTTKFNNTLEKAPHRDASSCSLETNNVGSKEKSQDDGKDVDVTELKRPGTQKSTIGRSVDTATTRVIKKSRRRYHKSKSKDLLRSLLKEGVVPDTDRSDQQPLMRAHLALSKESTPSSAQLDLAPALGARIEKMRVKNRLCQRNVLVPEGPKYDSKGRVYLQAYSPRGLSDYARTRPRRLVLPRCCNCCRKSVLGCE